MATPITQRHAVSVETTPALSLVKTSDAEPVEGTVVEHQGELVVERRPRPAWTQSTEQLKRHLAYARDNALDWAGHHATHCPHYAAWSLRGYARLALRWREQHRDDYPQLIGTAKDNLHAAKGNAHREADAKAAIEAYRAEYKRHKLMHWVKTGAWTSAAGAGAGTGVVFGGLWTEILMGIAAMAVGAWHGRPVQPAIPAPQAPRRASQLGEDTMRRVLVEAGAVPEKRGEEIRGVGIPHADGPGNACTIDMPSGIPASVAVGKKQQIAAAMGVHSDWLDLAVGDIESRLMVWVSHEDPFAVVRRSPLVGHKGALDLWNDGAPIVFGKRGDTVYIRVRDTMMLVGGATRRGKGMLIANLNLAAIKDVRVNLRLFDGKASGEHNAFAGLLATFVKKNPERLALFLRAVLEDMDRRADFLDERGKAKLSEDLIEEIGGLELIVIDELATYTAKGTSPFADEIVENLCQIAAVGASLGVLLVAATQVPEVDVVRGRLRQNLIARVAMNTESPGASNTIMGDGMAGQGYDASQIPLNQPGRCWMSTPDTGTIGTRSFLVEDDDKPPIVAEAHALREAAGRLPGQWRDPIEGRLVRETGVSSAAGGERGNGRIVRVDLLERLEILARSTGRGSVTNAEVFTAFAATDPGRYGRKDGETEPGWAARVGKVIRDEIDATGAALEVKRVTSPDGKRSQGYLLEDITTARNA